MTKDQVKKNLELLYRIKQMLIQRHGFKALIDDGKRITLAHKTGGKYLIKIDGKGYMVLVNHHHGKVSWKLIQNYIG